MRSLPGSLAVVILSWVLIVPSSIWYLRRRSRFPIRQRQPFLAVALAYALLIEATIAHFIFAEDWCEVFPTLVSSFMLALCLCFQEIRLKHFWWMSRVQEILTQSTASSIRSRTELLRDAPVVKYEDSAFYRFSFAVTPAGDAIQAVAGMLFFWLIPFMMSDGIAHPNDVCWIDAKQTILPYVVPCMLHCVVFLVFYLLLRKTSDKFYFTTECKLLAADFVFSILMQILALFKILDLDMAEVFANHLPVVFAIFIGLLYPVYRSYDVYVPRKTVPFLALIRTEKGSTKFEEHLKKEFSSENLLFWQEVEAFKRTFPNLSSEENSQRALGIFNRYVVNPTCYINLSGPLKAELEDVFEKKSKAVVSTVFDAAQAEIFALMENDSFLRFSSEPDFQDLCISIIHSPMISTDLPKSENKV